MDKNIGEGRDTDTERDMDKDT
jgi:hypothetical protein